MKKIRIGLLGYGTVGSEFVEILRKNKSQIMSKFDVEPVIEAILVRDVYKPRKTDTKGLKLTSDPEVIKGSKNLDIVVECMGGSGCDYTYEIIMALLEKGKSIIFSSKKCFALHYPQIIQVSEKTGSQIRFEATAGGGIPVMAALRQINKGDNVKSVYGIFNATSNFILTDIYKDNKAFMDALKQAQQMGIAENDPSEDIDGYDAAYKLSILAYAAMNVRINPERIRTSSIRNLSDEDYARSLSDKKVYKQIAYAHRDKDGNLKVYAGNVAVGSNSILSNIDGINNAIVIESENGGQKYFTGPGAGSGPTASVVFDDLISIISSQYFYKRPESIPRVVNIEEEGVLMNSAYE